MGNDLLSSRLLSLKSRCATIAQGADVVRSGKEVAANAFGLIVHRYKG